MDINEATATPDQLVEIGIGYIAKGVFRADKERGPDEAAQLGLDAIEAVRLIWRDFEVLRLTIPAGQHEGDLMRRNADGTVTVIRRVMR